MRFSLNIRAARVHVRRMAFAIYSDKGSNVREGSTDFSHVQNAAVIGAGVAGLQVALMLRKVGIKCKIFEQSDDVGGVWRKNYADFGLQVPRELYEFPGFPWPAEEERFPTGPAVSRYIQRFAKENRLYEMVKFSTSVVGLRPIGNGQRGWRVEHRPASSSVALVEEEEGSSTSENFDFCVVATGMYGSPPHLPVARGHEDFEGEILHSHSFLDRDVCKGKKVLVVGGGKSAIDCAVAASKTAASSTLLYRSCHWPVPRYLLNLVPFKFGTYSRFGHFMLPTHCDVGPVEQWVHGLFLPVKWSFWRVVEMMFRVQFGLKGDLLPTVPVELDVFTGGQILNYEFRDQLKAKKVMAIKGSIDGYRGKGVKLQDGTDLEADLVVYGTGFAKDYCLFDRAERTELQVERDGLYLYRNILPPRLSDLAFVGSEVSTFNNILTHALQAMWLQRVLTGAVTLPSRAHMEQTVEKDQAWKRSWMPATSDRAAILQLHMTKYHDQLCKDVGVPHRRKGNPLAEMFMPLTARDYAGLFK